MGMNGSGEAIYNMVSYTNRSLNPIKSTFQETALSPLYCLMNFHSRSFDIGRPEDDYLLTASGYSGDAGDSFTGQSGAKFSTKDRDLDSYSKSCAQEFKGAWWYTDCHGSNLNGFYYKGGPHGSYADGVNWAGWKGYNYSLKFVEMKVRPLSI